MPWNVALYETNAGDCPVEEFIDGLPERHAHKVRRVIALLEQFGLQLPFPHSSNVTGSEFQELRTTYAGRQYRVLYERVDDEFVAYVAFHKSSDRDLSRAVRQADRLRKERIDAET